MTLHLTWFQQDRIVQASDRLLSRAVGGRFEGEFDRAANKTVVVNTIDSIGSICFTGLAFVDEMPTDFLIAQSFHDFEIGEGPGGPALRFSPGLQSHTGFVGFPMLDPTLERMFERLEERLPFGQGASDSHLLGLVISGWRWPAERAHEREGYYLRPEEAMHFCCHVDWTYGGDRSLDWIEIDRETVLPLPSLDRPALDLVRRGLNGLDQSEQLDSEVLSEILKALSQRLDGVGSDVSLLELPHPAAGREGTYRYLGTVYPMPPFSDSPLPYGSYGPWLLSPGLSISSGLHADDFRPVLVGYKFRIEGENVEGHSGFGGQPRKPAP